MGTYAIFANITKPYSMDLETYKPYFIKHKENLENEIVRFVENLSPFRNAFRNIHVIEQGVYGCFDPFWRNYSRMLEINYQYHSEGDLFYFGFTEQHLIADDLLKQINSENKFLQVRKLCTSKYVTMYTIDFSPVYHEKTRKYLSYYIHHLFRQTTTKGITALDAFNEFIKDKSKIKPIQLILKYCTGYMGIIDFKLDSTDFELNFNNYEYLNNIFNDHNNISIQKQTILTEKLFIATNYPDLCGPYLYSISGAGEITIYLLNEKGEVFPNGMWLKTSTKTLLWTSYAKEKPVFRKIGIKESGSFFTFEAINKFFSMHMEDYQEQLEYWIDRIRNDPALCSHAGAYYFSSWSKKSTKNIKTLVVDKRLIEEDVAEEGGFPWP